MSEITFKDTLVCEKLTETLISISKMLKGTKNQVIFTDKHAFLKEANSDTAHEIAREVDGMYHMKPIDQISNKVAVIKLNESETTEVTNFRIKMAKHSKISPPGTQNNGDRLNRVLKQTHHRFGHFHWDSILKSLRLGGGDKNKEFSDFLKIARDSKLPKILDFCDDCAIGKIKRRSIKSTLSPAKQTLDRIHTDCIPLPCENPQRNLHGTIVVDGYSRYAAIIFHRHKSDTLQILKQIINAWETTQHPKRVKAIRHDDGELQNRFEEYCNTRDAPIINETSPAYDKAFNGLVERTYGVHKANAITLLNQARLPPKFLSYALRYSIHVKNRLVHPEIEDTTPYTVWFGKSPDLTKLQPFGCKVTMLLSKEQRQGFYGDRGTPGIFLGYEGNTLYEVYRLDQQRIVTSSTCIFHDEYPGITRHSDENLPSDDKLPEEETTTPGNQYMLRSQVSGEEQPIPLTSDIEQNHSQNANQTETPDQRDIADEIENESNIDSSQPEADTEQDSEIEDLPEIYVELDLTPETADKLSAYGIENILIAKHTVDKTEPNSVPVPYKDPKDTPPKGSILMAGIPPAPTSRKKMLEHPYRDYFIAAEKVELNAMYSQKVWKKGPVPPGRKLLRPKWIYSYKIDPDNNSVARFKARLVAMGNTQTEGVDYIDTFSPVIKVQTLRIMLVIALRYGMYIGQEDVKTAYLNAELAIRNFMHMPEGYEEFNENGQKVFLHLLKSIYGLHQSGREWNIHITENLIKLGFTQSRSDPCLFIRKNKDKTGFILLYVDDLVIMALTSGEVNDIKTELKKEYSISDLGEAKHILGLQIEHVRKGIYLGQPAYIDQIIGNADMNDCSIKHTPMSVDWAHDPSSEKLDKKGTKAYYSLVMQLAYLANQTRPDIAYAVNLLSQYQNDCRIHDMEAVRRVVQYLKGTRDFGLYYQKEGFELATLHSNEENILENWVPQGYADASFAQEDGRKSRSGHVFLMSGAAVTWMSKKQPVVALSSTEAEYYALSEAMKETIWIRHLMEEIDLTLNDPTIVHQDNMSTIAIAVNPIQHQRVKHMDIKVHFLRDHLHKKDAVLMYCPTEDMVADILTKALPTKAHQKFTQLMGLRSLSQIQTVEKIRVWRY
jgi:hypothetical protein